MITRHLHYDQEFFFFFLSVKFLLNLIRVHRGSNEILDEAPKGQSPNTKGAKPIHQMGQARKSNGSNPTQEAQNLTLNIRPSTAATPQKRQPTRSGGRCILAKQSPSETSKVLIRTKPKTQN